jgi:hypothetical protein
VYVAQRLTQEQPARAVPQPEAEPALPATTSPPPQGEGRVGVAVS